MAFWGVEVKPGSPYVHRCDADSGRLHVSQATLGNGSSTTKTILQCEVEGKKPIYLCSLIPEKLETCALNLEFEEDDEVTLSIIGSHSVHLSGFFYGNDEDQDNLEDDYGSDQYEEDIMVTDSEDEDDSIDYDSEDGSEDDLNMYPTSSLRKSGVRIEEIVDEEKPTNQSDKSKRAKKLKTQSSMSDDNVNNQQIVVKAGNSVPVLESEDEDGFPVSANGDKSGDSKSEARANDQKIDEKTPKRNEKDGTNHGKKSTKKVDAVGQDGESARENIEPISTPVQPDAIIPDGEVKQKKNKKRKAAEKTVNAPENGITNSTTEEFPVAELGNDSKMPLEKKKEKKKKKKQRKETESSATPTNAEEKATDKKTSALEKQDKGAKPLQVRTFPNGLMIEELVMGKPDGKRASSGKKVSVRYIGKLRKNGKIFDSNTGNRPFKFRLGIGEVIKGWDVGVNGMRVGDKRRLTIPPAMGYGAKGVGAIPPNSWLVFDVELVEVN